MAELAPESKAFVELVKQVGPIDLTLPAATIRELNELNCQRLKGDFVFSGTREELAVPAVDDGVSYEIPVTILRPTDGQQTSWEKVMVYFHGGGWCWSSRNTHMTFCEMISSRCNCVVVNVEYRLSPEHKFPACYVDAKAVVEWCLSNKNRLANNPSALLGVGGDSAGANISASVCHMVSGLDFQVLIYASLTLSARNLYPSYLKYGDGYLLTQELMLWFHNNFLSDPKEAADVRCSPMDRETFTGLPPALLIVCECDPLADQSPAYRDKLESAGVPTHLVTLKSTVHGFVSKTGHFKETTNKTVNIIKEYLSKL